MKTKTRFIQSVLKTASEQGATPMPWTRGKSRKALIAKREEPIRKSA